MGALNIVGATLIALSLTTACSVRSNGTFCAIASPIPITQETIDHLTDAEVAALLAHQEKGGKLCHWKP